MNIDRYIKKTLPGERIVQVLRPHWMVHLFQYSQFIGLLAVPFFFYIGAKIIFPGIFVHPIGFPFLLISMSLYILVMWSMLYTAFIDLHLDMWVITTHRIVGMEQHGLFNRQVYEHSLAQIQDINSTQQGMLETFFNYGTVLIQTASMASPSSFEGVADPVAVTQMINTLMRDHPDAKDKEEKSKEAPHS